MNTPLEDPAILPASTAVPLQTLQTLQSQIAHAIKAAGGWIGFDTFMQLALYTPGWGYYSRNAQQFGLMPARSASEPGSDFATAPEISPHFGRTLAQQVAEAMDVTSCSEVWEFGAGSGALAEQILQALGSRISRYTIVDVSGSLRQKQQQRLAVFGSQVAWADALPDTIHGIVLGNEVLDAMPVKLLVRPAAAASAWLERGVALVPEDSLNPPEGGCMFAFADRPSLLEPPLEAGATQQLDAHTSYVTEIHPQAEAFIRTLADRLKSGAIFLIDYGFPAHEYYHPQRSMGTVMCHRAHQMDGNPLLDVGDKDITAHVNFTGIALAGQDAGLRVVGYTSQGRFLLNCGLLALPALSDTTDRGGVAGLSERSRLQKLINEHEMGELFKVIAFAAVPPAHDPEARKRLENWQPLGFTAGDRLHTL